MKSLLLLFLTCLILITSSYAQSGRFENITVYSQALEGNLLGDSSNRNVSVYLPWKYDSISTARLPVIYMLHGFTTTNFSFINSYNLEGNFNSFFNQSGRQPMIIVIADNYNTYRGSWYTNSIVTGDWEDFMTQDLVEYIDSNYRTISDRESRGIAGHSMGGYGAMTLAMKNPDIYSAVYSLSGASLVIEDVALGTMFNYLVEAANGTVFNGLPWQAQTFVAGGAAWSPNINTPPFMCDFPIEPSGVLIDSTWQKWLEHDPFSMIETYKNNLLQYNGNIRFDCGDDDTYLFGANQHFHQALDSANIPHDFYEYDGDHTNQIQVRIRWAVLPFFSDYLVDVKSEYQNVPDEFSLFQNYPNPFNPSTKIRYSVPQSSNVVIKVFDVLGNEITTLVNEEKPIGTYEITWYAENLPSGVYFFRLQAGSFVETKKMVLMK